MSDSEVLISGDGIFVLTGSRLIHEGEKIITGAKLCHEVELYSCFPLPLDCDRVSVSLQCRDATSPGPAPRHRGGSGAGAESLARTVARRTLSSGSSGGSMTGHRNVGRADSLASNASILSRQGTALIDSLSSLSNRSCFADSWDPNPHIIPAHVVSKDDERRLVIAEQFDFKQDKSLSSVRLVCHNASAILKRKDSSGSILRDGSAKKGSFLYKMATSPGPVTIQPGLNSIVLETAAGPVAR